MRLTLFLPAVVVVLSSSGAHAARRVAVLPVSGVNIHVGYLEAAHDILRDHLMSTRQFDVVNVPGAPPAQELSPQEAVALGRPSQAEMVVVTHIVRLAGKSRVRVTAFRTADASLAHTDSMMTAGGPDDLDPVLKRLAVALATGKPVATTGEIDSVTQDESDPYLKQTATKTFGVRLGAMIPVNGPGEVSTATGIGLFWLYDAREFMGEVWGDFTHSSSQSITTFNLGIAGYYPFTRRNVTPYIGGGGAWSSLGGGEAGGSGMRVHAAGGVLIGRLWTVQARAELGYFFNLFRTTSTSSTPNTTTMSSSYGHGPMLTVGLGF
jgi:hypothetical protein